MNRNWKQIATLIIALGVLTFSAPQATGEVVFSTFSPGDGFSAGAVGLNIFIDIAVSFVPQKDFTLDSVRVAVTHAFGPNDYVIRVTEDRCGSFLAPGGQPSATPLESLTGLVFPQGLPGIFTANSLTNPVLVAGHTYWIWMTSSATEPLGLDWHQNNLDPLALVHSLSISGGPWTVIPDNPKPAFDVNGTATEPPPPIRITSVHAANFDPELGASAESIVSGFGMGARMAFVCAAAQTIPLPTLLEDVEVRVTDSAGTARPAALFFVSGGQINYEVPAGTAPGLAMVEVLLNGQVVAEGDLQISAVAPGLFSVDASGQGLAAALFLRVPADGPRIQDFVFDLTTRAAVPIDLGPEGDRIFLLLFGTGIRGFTGEVTATVGGEEVRVLGAVPQGQFVGLDQVNLGPLPRSLTGRGEVDIVLTVDGKVANTVTVTIQ